MQLTVNRALVDVEAEPQTTLADLLRDELHLTGTKLGCEHGVCGSCTVIVNGDALRSCMLLAVQCADAEITTIEGLADGAQLHPVQRAFAEAHGLQCGFCTPGFVLLVAAALREDPGVVEDEERLVALLSSNLCRCTGYVNIVRAARRATELLGEAAGPRPATGGADASASD